MTRVAFSVLALLVAATTNSDEWFEGENLLLAPPDSEKYQTYVKKKPNWHSTMWVDRETEGQDTVTVNVLPGRRANLSEFRRSQDQPGEESCNEFNSWILDDSDRNGYQSASWATECQLGDATIKSIQLAIRGNDSFYHVRKLWRKEVTDFEYAEWTQRLAAASLCDTRKKKKHPCPDGFEKVEELYRLAYAFGRNSSVTQVEPSWSFPTEFAAEAAPTSG